MITVEGLKKSIVDLKKEVKKKLTGSENLKADKELRIVRKKLKRAQRKLRILCPPISKTKPEEMPKEQKTG